MHHEGSHPRVLDLPNTVHSGFQRSVGRDGHRFGSRAPNLWRTVRLQEHWQGNLKGLGDELGTDCWIQQLVEVEGRVWPRAYAGDGRRNEDWYGWGKSVLSPCTCEVIKINLNMTVNQPGVIGKPPASFVVLKREDGVYFMLAHVADVVPKVGEPIEAGQLLAHVGNNGYARLPHIHIGAWRGDTPLQIKFDQAAMGKLLER